MSTKRIRPHCVLGEEAEGMLKMAMTELNLSARAYDCILKVARTIADLGNADRSPPITLAKRFNTARWIGICGCDPSYAEISAPT